MYPCIILYPNAVSIWKVTEILFLINFFKVEYPKIRIAGLISIRYKNSFFPNGQMTINYTASAIVHCNDKDST